MKYLLMGLLVLIGTNGSLAQKIRSISDIDSLVSQINNMELRSDLDYSLPHCDSIGNVVKGNITYTFKSDSIQRRLRKVIVKDDNYKQTTDYYFNNDQLIYIRSRFGIRWFRDSDFSVGTIWRDENDLDLLKREREIATAYRLLNMYKKMREVN